MKKKRKTPWILCVCTGLGCVLLQASAAAGTAGNQGQHASGTSNLLGNVYTGQSNPSTRIDRAIRNIWVAINHNHVQTAGQLIARAEKQFVGWHPQPEMELVLAEKQIWSDIGRGHTARARRRMRQVQQHYGTGPFAEQLHQVLLSMDGGLVDHQLWVLLGKNRMERIRSTVTNARHDIPGYRPPAAFVAAWSQAREARLVGLWAEKKEWGKITGLYGRSPEAFSERYPENRELLAEAQAKQGDLLPAARRYYQLLRQTVDVQQAGTLLQQAGPVLPHFCMQILYHRAERQFPRQTVALEREHLDYLLSLAATEHARNRDSRAWRLLTPHLSAIRILHRPSDARLVAGILGARHRPQQSLLWWSRAARWSGRNGDWETVTRLAEADGLLPPAAQGLAHLPNGSSSARKLGNSYYQVQAVRAYKSRDYGQAVRDLDSAQRLGPLSPGLENIRGWSLLHMQKYPEAALVFAALYRKSPTSGNAAGLVVSSFHAGGLAGTYRLAAASGGPLAADLPMAIMRNNEDSLGQIGWRLLPSTRIAPPEKRQDFIALGGSYMHRTGSAGGTSRFSEYLPSLQVQYGIDWHLAAYAQISAAGLYSGQPNAQQLPVLLAPASGLLSGVATGHVWQSPQFLLGLDDRKPYRHWRAAIGWTAPSALGGGTVQGVLRYTGIPGGGASYWSVHLLRDSVRQSLISYNGLTETLAISPAGQEPAAVPYTWGAAIRNQAGISGYLGGGRRGWSYIGTLHLDAITGRNIRTDYGASAYLSMMKPVYGSRYWWMAVGPSVYAEGYTRNENFTSPGYGGYYSPQWMAQPAISLALSHWWTGGSVSLGASLGYQFAYQEGGPYLGLPGMASSLPPAFASGHVLFSPYGSSRNGNVAGSVNLLLTQKLSHHWYLDGGAAYEANPAFSEVQTGLDIRYVFGGNGAVHFDPAKFVMDMGRFD